MTVTPSSFRTDFSAFADASVYPDDGIQFWLTIAGLSLDPCRWAEMLDLGAELFVAHNLILEQQSNRTAATGGIPGVTSGPIASKSVDKLAVAYDVQAAILEGGGDFNLTTYGLRFLRMARMFGSGGMQL